MHWSIHVRELTPGILTTPLPRIDSPSDVVRSGSAGNNCYRLAFSSISPIRFPSGSRRKPIHSS
jgi:hypothetical protein